MLHDLRDRCSRPRPPGRCRSARPDRPCPRTIIFLARIKPPSLPVKPTARPPCWLMRLTISLLTCPPSTISTTSIVSASVTRMPWTNSPFLPTRFSSSSICGPPPCTIDRIHADQLEQHDVAREAFLQLLVGHGVAAVLDDDRLAVEALDVRQRLGEDFRFVGSGGAGEGHDGRGSVMLARYSTVKKSAGLSTCRFFQWPLSGIEASASGLC